jgi:NosR/NirI family transcriptional regulator, nitrous oxide reductase regulator
MKALKTSAIVTALAAVVFGLYHYYLISPPTPDPVPHLSAVMPGALHFEKKEGGPFPYYAAIGGSGPVGALFVTTDLAHGIRGYAGEVPVLVGMRPDGRITGIKILANNETPSYLARVDRPAFTGRFEGKSASDPFVLDSDLDGVTRATMTAGAVASGVRAASRRAASGLFGLSMPAETAAGTKFLKDPSLYLLAALFAAAIAFYLRGRSGRDTRMLRWVVLAGSFAVVGVYRAMPVSLGNYFNLAAMRFPGLDGISWHVLVWGSLVMAVLWGRLYCGWLCPFGALQELLARIPAPKLSVSGTGDRTARYIKYALLWTVTVVAFTAGLIEIGGFEPYTTLFSWQGGMLAWSFVAFTLGAAVFVPRFWCRYFCPVGACLGLVSRFSVLKRKRFEGCTNCGACTQACTMGNREGGETGYLRSECIGCNACIAVCPERRAKT